MDSLQIVEDFCGQDLDPELLQRLASGPQEHIASVVERLAGPWYDWYDNALEDDSGLDDFHFMASDSWNSDSRIMPASEYKKLALYYPSGTEISGKRCVVVRISSNSGLAQLDTSIQCSAVPDVQGL